LFGAGLQSFVLRLGFVELGLSPGLRTMQRVDRPRHQQDASQRPEDSWVCIAQLARNAFQIATLREICFRLLKMP